MSTPPLPYPARAASRWAGCTACPALTEMRMIRDRYGFKTAEALARRYRNRIADWRGLIDRASQLPSPGNIDGLLIHAELLMAHSGPIDPGSNLLEDWAAITRFVATAQAVWEMECDLCP